MSSQIDERLHERAQKLSQLEPNQLMGYVAALLEHLVRSQRRGTKALSNKLDETVRTHNQNNEDLLDKLDYGFNGLLNQLDETARSQDQNNRDLLDKLDDGIYVQNTPNNPLSIVGDVATDVSIPEPLAVKFDEFALRFGSPPIPVEVRNSIDVSGKIQIDDTYPIRVTNR